MLNTTIQLTEQEATIRKATQKGTPDFEHGAWFSGSKIYRCDYTDIGYTYESTMSIKDGRAVITEQNLHFKPAMVWFYYVQQQPARVFEKLEALVAPQLSSKRKDLMKHDYQAIVENQNSTPFVYGFRDSGTELLHMPPTIEEAINIDLFKRREGLERDEEIRQALASYFKNQITCITQQSKGGIHHDGCNVRVCSFEEMSKIYLEHFTRLIANWKISSLQLARIPEPVLSTQK